MSAKAKARRLRPASWDGLVLAYLRRHRAKEPLSASAIAKGFGRSPRAVANGPSGAGGEGEAARRKPRAYELKAARGEARGGGLGGR